MHYPYDSTSEVLCLKFVTMPLLAESFFSGRLYSQDGEPSAISCSFDTAHVDICEVELCEALSLYMPSLVQLTAHGNSGVRSVAVYVLGGLAKHGEWLTSRALTLLMCT